MCSVGTKAATSTIFRVPPNSSIIDQSRGVWVLIVKKLRLNSETSKEQLLASKYEVNSDRESFQFFPEMKQ